MPLDRPPWEFQPEPREYEPSLEAWRVAALLDGKDPKELVARLLDGDPLGLEGIVPLWLTDGAFLLDAEEFGYRLVAELALHAPPETSQELLGSWFVDRMHTATRSLLSEASRRSQLGRLGLDDVLIPERSLADALGVDPTLGHQLLVAFNDLPYVERHAFMHLVLLNVPTAEYLQRHGLDGRQVRSRLDAASMALMSRNLHVEDRPDPIGNLLHLIRDAEERGDDSFDLRELLGLDPDAPPDEVT